MSVTNYKDRMLPPVAPADLVDANGSCAGAVAASGEDVPMIPAAIALEMSECDVVKRAGIAEKVEIGDERTTRAHGNTDLHQGPAAGHLSFHGGTPGRRWSSRPSRASAKPAKKPAKPTKRAAQPNQVSVQ